MKDSVLKLGEEQRHQGRRYRLSLEHFNNLEVPDIKLRQLAKKCGLKRCHKAIRTKNFPRAADLTSSFCLLQLEQRFHGAQLRALLKALGYRAASVWEVFAFLCLLARRQRKKLLLQHLIAAGSRLSRKRGEIRIPYVNSKLQARLSDGEVFSELDIFLVARLE